MEDKKINLTVNVQKALDFSRQDIDDLMVCALEGGINYWCSHVKVLYCPEKYVYASDVISRNGCLEMYDAESSDKWELTLEKFLNGLRMYCEREGYTDAGDLMDNHDADVVDEIVQYALFNEIVFC